MSKPNRFQFTGDLPSGCLTTVTFVFGIAGVIACLVYSQPLLAWPIGIATICISFRMGISEGVTRIKQAYEAFQKPPDSLLHGVQLPKRSPKKKVPEKK